MDLGRLGAGVDETEHYLAVGDGFGEGYGAKDE
jgi:hypothetical protein